MTATSKASLRDNYAGRACARTPATAGCRATAVVPRVRHLSVKKAPRPTAAVERESTVGPIDRAPDPATSSSASANPRGRAALRERVARRLCHRRKHDDGRRDRHHLRERAPHPCRGWRGDRGATRGSRVLRVELLSRASAGNPEDLAGRTGQPWRGDRHRGDAVAVCASRGAQTLPVGGRARGGRHCVGRRVRAVWQPDQLGDPRQADECAVGRRLRSRRSGPAASGPGLRGSVVPRVVPHSAGGPTAMEASARGPHRPVLRRHVSPPILPGVHQGGSGRLRGHEHGTSTERAAHHRRALVLAQSWLRRKQRAR